VKEHALFALSRELFAVVKAAKDKGMNPAIVQGALIGCANAEMLMCDVSVRSAASAFDSALVQYRDMRAAAGFAADPPSIHPGPVVLERLMERLRADDGGPAAALAQLLLGMALEAVVTPGNAARIAAGEMPCAVAAGAGFAVTITPESAPESAALQLIDTTESLFIAQCEIKRLNAVLYGGAQ